LIIRAKRVNQMLIKKQTPEFCIFKIQFHASEVVVDHCGIIFCRQLSKVVYPDNVVLFSLRKNNLALLFGGTVLYVVDKVKKKNESEICMDTIRSDNLKEFPIAIRFNWHVKETLVRLELLLRGSRFYGFRDEIELRFY